jgi:hypothetical protein
MVGMTRSVYTVTVDSFSRIAVIEIEWGAAHIVQFGLQHDIGL